MELRRTWLLTRLEKVSAALERKDTTGQNDCFVFQKGRVRTFNEFMTCSCVVGLPIDGAVLGKPLIELLKKLPDDKINVEVEDGVLVIKGKRRRSKIAMEEDILFPSVETPEEWEQLDKDFVNCIKTVCTCAGDDYSKLTLTCVHVHPDYLEALDNSQAIRYHISTRISKPVLVNKVGLSKLKSDAIEFCITRSYMHFRCADKSILSCRLFDEEYADLSSVMEREGDRVEFPANLKEIIGRTDIFDSDNVTVSLKRNKIRFLSRNNIGSFEEIEDVQYSGPSMSFKISPKMLLEMSNPSVECLLSRNKLMAVSDNFTYVASLIVEDE